MNKFTTCPKCGRPVLIRNRHVEYWMKQTGKRPMCAECRAFVNGRHVGQHTANYRELEY